MAKLYQKQQECLDRVDILEVWRKQFSDEDVKQQLQTLSGKLQESVRNVTNAMPPPQGSNSVGQSDQAQTTGDLLGLGDVTSGWFGSRTRETSPPREKPLSPGQVAANCDLPEEQLLRALEAASEAGARQALDSLNDLTSAQTMFGIKLKEYEKRLISMEEQVGVLGPDGFRLPSGAARALKFCC